MKNATKLFFFAGLICKIICAQSYSIPELNDTFRCHTNSPYRYRSEYIPDEYFCDAFYHCDDQEDEHFGCELNGTKVCGAGKFVCDGGQCKNISVRCNTIKDCHDGTDELNCGDEINVKNCTSEDKFPCKDGLRCLSLEYTCDGVCNCFDCSDENENCSKHDNNLLNKCPHSYFVTANGPQCICKSSNDKSIILCDKVQQCVFGIMHRMGNTYRCEQRCIRFKWQEQCSCYEGYEASNGTFGSKCRTIKDFAIIYTNENEIKYVNNTFLETSTILHGISNCTLLTAANNYVYYTTLSQYNRTSIFKIALHSGEPEKLIETDFAITSIAVDYTTNNIYFTGGGSLSVCTSDGRICTQLKCCDVDSVTLAPKSGWMYYMKKQLDYPDERFCRNEFLLARSNMDGSNETVHEEHCFGIEFSMKIHESKNEINLLSKDKEYQKDMILYSIPINSAFNVYNVLQTNVELLSGIRSFSFHHDDIFYTLNGARSIFYFKEMTYTYFLFNRERVAYLNDTSPITNVFIYNQAIEFGNEHPCNKSTCSGLCLIKPTVSTTLSYACLCNDFTFTRDNQWCTSEPAQTVSHIILGLSVLIILAGAGYYLFNKRWYGYYLALRQWERSRRDQRIIND